MIASDFNSFPNVHKKNCIMRLPSLKFIVWKGCMQHMAKSQLLPEQLSKQLLTEKKSLLEEVGTMSKMYSSTSRQELI